MDGSDQALLTTRSSHVYHGDLLVRYPRRPQGGVRGHEEYCGRYSEACCQVADARVVSQEEPCPAQFFAQLHQGFLFEQGSLRSCDQSVPSRLIFQKGVTEDAQTMRNGY